MWVELPLVVISGLLGSAHCVGMCGPFALLLGTASRSWQANLGRQLTYSVGRIFTYAALGAAAGVAGLRLAVQLPTMVNVPAVLAMVAGAGLIYQGLSAAGIWRKRGVAGGPPCLATGLLSTFLRGPGHRDVFLAGVFTGLLPCGLVYAFLALAASSGNLLRGAALMAAFGCGTVPVMVLTGTGGRLLNLAARQKLLQAAAWCVVMAGVLSVIRGAGYWGVPIEHAVHACPWCD